MNFINIPCNITFKRNHDILVETPWFVSFAKDTFGSEMAANRDMFTYGGWEIFLSALRDEARAQGRQVCCPNGTWFSTVLRTWTYHVMPGLKALVATNPNHYPHSYIFSLPYFINDKNELEVPNYSNWLGKFKRITYNKNLKYSEEQ